MQFTDVVSQLETALGRDLPGPAAQDLLAPIPRREWPSGFDPARLRHAAGLLLVFPKPDLGRNSAGPRSDFAHIVLTVRSDSLGRHSGQVSLPGGVVEPGETFEQAAIREAHEEIALDPEGNRVIGALTPLEISVSGFRLHPIVAVRNERPRLTPSDGEVARILELGVHELMHPACVQMTERTRDGRPINVPAFRVHGAEIWGATAMILAEFLTLLGWNRSESI